MSFSASIRPPSAMPALPRGLSSGMGRLKAIVVPSPAYSGVKPAGILPFWAMALDVEGIIVFDSEFERSLFDLRKAKLEEIEKLGQAAYPNQFPASHTVPEVRAKWGDATAEALEASRVTIAVAGRIMAIRGQG